MAEDQDQDQDQAPAPAPSMDEVHKTVVSATSALANLLPTGTVLAFQSLAPSFSNSGTCHGNGFSNILLTAALVAFCSLACFLSSFTDSFTTSDGRLLYGIATLKGFYVFNAAAEEDGEYDGVDLSRYRIKGIDYVHAVASLVVFLVVSVGDHDVLRCFFPDSKGVVGENQLFVNLPLGIGVLASCLFVVFPTTRRGIGYADMAAASRLV